MANNEGNRFLRPRNIFYAITTVFAALWGAGNILAGLQVFLPNQTQVANFVVKTGVLEAMWDTYKTKPSEAKTDGMPESIFKEPLPKRLTSTEMKEARKELEKFKTGKDGSFKTIYNSMASVMKLVSSLSPGAKDEKEDIEELRKQIYQIRHAKISTIDDCKVYEAIHVTEYRRVILTLAETLGIPEARVKSLFLAENLDKHEETFKTFDIDNNGQVLFGKILVQRIHPDWLSMMYTFSAVRFTPESKENQPDAERFKSLVTYNKDGKLSASFEGADAFKKYFLYVSKKYFIETCQFSKDSSS